jgi:hypothetical protein
MMDEKINEKDNQRKSIGFSWKIKRRFGTFYE